MRAAFSHRNNLHPSLVVIAPLLLVAACGFTDSASDARIRNTITDGLRRDWNTVLVPDGAIDVVPGWTAAALVDTAKHRVTPKFAEGMRVLQSVGLLTITQINDVMLIVNPSDSLRHMAETTQSIYLVVPLADVQITSIVSDSAYSSPSLPSSERFKLVFGEYKTEPNHVGRALGGEGRTYQFKALLRYDPFTKAYLYVTADYRKPGEEWASHNVK